MVQDIVCLQEVFTREDETLLIQAAKGGRLKHALLCNAGMVHGELLLLSAFLIEEVRIRICLNCL